VYTGYAWRCVLKALILMSVDEVNVLRYTRGLQLALPFLTGYEAYVIDQVIETLEHNIALEKEKKALILAPISKVSATRAEDKVIARKLYMYVYIYIDNCIYKCICIYTYIYVHIYTYICI
jgi:hypothetical protein